MTVLKVIESIIAIIATLFFVYFSNSSIPIPANSLNEFLLF